MIKPLVGIIAILLMSSALVVAGSQGSVYVPRVPLFAICAGIGFILHWLVFIPSYYYQTEHYFDLTGSLSYISAVTVAVFMHPLLDLRGLLIAVLQSLKNDFGVTYLHGHLAVLGCLSPWQQH